PAVVIAAQQLDESRERDGAGAGAMLPGERTEAREEVCGDRRMANPSLPSAFLARERPVQRHGGRALQRGAGEPGRRNFGELLDGDHSSSSTSSKTRSRSSCPTRASGKSDGV